MPYYSQQYPMYPPTYPAYQPYMGTPPQVTPIQPAQPQQMTAPAYQQSPAVQALQGKFVDSIESVRATDVMMDGSVMYFPSTDGKVIYTKQLQSDGTSRILTFVNTPDAVQPETVQPNVTEILDGSLKKFRDEILAGFEDVNDRFDKIERQLKAKSKEGDKA